MAKISQYIVKEFLLYFLTCLLALLVITTVFSALAELKLLEKPNGLTLFIEAILSGIPLLIEIITPVSVLLATVLTFTTLSKTSETIAMMAAGVSLFRMVLPVLIVGAFISLFTYFNQSYLAPWWGSDKRVSVVNSSSREVSWQFFQGQLFYFSGLAKKKQTVSTAKIFGFSESYRLEAIDNLESLVREGEDWTYQNGKTLIVSPTNLQSADHISNTMKGTSLPVVFKKELSHPKYSDFGSLITEIRLKHQGAVDFEPDLFALYQKVSNVITVFIMILLALPFSLFSGRSSNVRTGIVLSVIIGFTFWLSDQIFVSLQGTGLLPAELSAFAANIAFFLLFLVLIRLRRV